MAIPAIISASSRTIKGTKKSENTQLFLCIFTLGVNQIFELPETAFTSLLYRDPKKQFLQWGEAEETLEFKVKQSVPLSMFKHSVTETKGVSLVDCEFFTFTVKGVVPEFITEEVLLTIKPDKIKEDVSIGGKVITLYQGKVHILHNPEKQPRPVAELFWKVDDKGRGILSVVPFQDGVKLQGESKLLREVSKYISELHLLEYYFGREGVKLIALDMIQGIAHGRDINSVVSLDSTQLTAIMQRTAITRSMTTRKQLTGTNSEPSLADRQVLNRVKSKLPIDF